MKTKIGLLCSLDHLQRWELNLINHLITDSQKDFTIIDVRNLSNKNRSYNFNLNKILYVLFSKFEYRILKLLKKINFLDFVERPDLKLPVIKILAKRKAHITEIDFNSFRYCDFDYFIRINGIAVLYIPDYLKVPILSIHHGDMYSNRGGPAGFWEVFKQKDISTITLQKLTNDLDGGEIIHQIYCKTIKYSFILNQENLYCRSFLLFEDFFNLNLRKQSAPIVKPLLLRVPSNIIYLIYIVKAFVELSKKIFYLKQRWSVFVEIGKNRRKIVSGAEDWYADPFFISDSILIMEKYINKCKKGIIVTYDLELNKEKVLLDENYHLSHPFVFKWNDKTYVVPESHDNGKVSLYSYTLDGDLEFVKHLLVGKYVDSLLFFFRGVFYILTTELDGNFNERKILFKSFDFLNCDFNRDFDFLPIYDPRVTRSAGFLEVFDENLENYCQYPFPYYGNKISIYNIDLKGNYTLKGFIEIDSPRYNGIHHFSRSNLNKCYDLRS